MSRQKLSVVILSFNAENKIKNCLESIKWADEIILIDGQSTDNTINIAKEYGAKIDSHKFKGSFAEERNLGTNLACGDWILQLDTDEVVTEKFKNEIINILENNNEFVSYKFIRKNFFLGKALRYGGWLHHSHHFFKKGFARYTGEVHETLEVSGKSGIINAGVEHYPFDNLTQFIERQNRYTSLEAQRMLSEKGIVLDKEIKYNLKIRPIKLFWKMYFKKQGFREGRVGFIFSVLFAWVHFLKWAKYWELTKDKL